MSTLQADLDGNIERSPRFKASSVAEYFRDSALKWWQPDKACHKEQSRAIDEWLKELEPRNALELGAGFGRISKLIDKIPGVELTLVDINTRAVKILRKEFPERDVQQITLEKFGFSKAPYDLVASIGVMVHVPDLVALTSRIHSALGSGGSWITSLTPTAWYEKQNIKRAVIHRGIDPVEFDSLISKRFEIADLHMSSNRQLYTYHLKKRA